MFVHVVEIETGKIAAAIPIDEMIVALGRFRDDLRRDVLAAHPKATADALLSKTNRAATRMVVVKTTLDAGTVDEAVQRCAVRQQLKATLLRCT